MAGVNQIRSAFLDYFAGEGHESVASGPLVPRNDPTLLFTNAGMVPFKNVFTGAEKRPYVRAASSQKCVRAGGKHNDLDNVGYTARHHTFFEMLGNFSFGDYFKERAIELAWTLITKEFGLPKDKLLVTVYAEDDQAFDLWGRIAGLPDEKIIRIATSDNFWTMGETGPCGPCSEIFFDHGEGIPGGPPGSPDEDGDRFIEIWNLVFMQYEQVSKDDRIDLPRPSIDTGMGLERIAAVLQGVHDNYDIDLFQTLIAASADATSTDPRGPQAASHRVIADHLRTSCFLIADGVLPSNEGRGYVLRRIMRRAMRHAQLLGSAEPLMWRLVPTLVAEMGQAFPELVQAQALITDTLRREEVRFRQTLTRGLSLLDEATAGLDAGDRLEGSTAFKLYDTYGFPLDLTQDALRARDISVDTDGFDAAMAEQKAQARAAWSGSGDTAQDGDWFGLRDRVGATEFLGYDTEKAEGAIVAILKDAEVVETASAGEIVQIVVNQTPFYAESGGQVGDTGTIVGEKGRGTVRDAKKKAGDLFVHEVVVEEGAFSVGEAAILEVDHARRSAIRSNHTGTHLLHEALRGALGDHVAQRGSLVAADRLRFDFVHHEALTPDEIARVEREVNAYVRQNDAVTTRLMSPDEAQKEGARALFGEKYGDEVRVVSLGHRPDGEDGPAGSIYSLELCGGTHVRRAGDIGAFVVTSEGASASGIRRIEALTGAEAYDYLTSRDRQLGDAASALKVRAEDVPARVRALMDERRDLERQLAQARKQLAMGGGGSDNAIRDIKGVKLFARVAEGISLKELRGLVDEGKAQVGSGIVAIAGVSEDGKAGIAVGVTDDLTAQFNAVDLVRVGSMAMGGKGGGGRADMAQAGGPDASKASEAVEAIASAIGGGEAVAAE